MKNLRFFILAIVSCFLGLFAVACNQMIEFDYNIDFVVDGQVIATVGTNGDKIAMPKNPTKEDYTFDGWYWDEGEWGDEFTLNSILDQPLQDENHYKVYAKWKSSGYYTIKYYPNGGAGEPVTQMVANNTNELLMGNSFSAPEYKVFDCWSTTESGRGFKYQAGEKAPLENNGYELKLYARWKWADDVVVIDCFFTDWSLYIGNTKGRVFVLEEDVYWDDPIGLPETPFEGLFLGNGYKIDCYELWEKKSAQDNKTYGGLFGYIGKNGVVKDVHVIGSIYGEWVGSFATVNLGLIENCSSSATVRVKERDYYDYWHYTRNSLGAAGIVGTNGGTIRNCVFNGSVMRGQYTDYTSASSLKLAGLCIENCYNYVESGTLENCLLLGELYVSNSYSGSLEISADAIAFASYGVTKNNYYTEESIEASNWGNATNATSVVRTRVTEKSFYTDVLGWDEDDWDFSQLGEPSPCSNKCPKPKKKA